MTQSTIQFRVGTKHGKKKTVKWDVTHNLPETFGLSLDNAFDSWLARTDDPDDMQAFVDYVKSKDPENIVCNAKDVSPKE